MAIVGFGNHQETGAMTAPASFSLLAYLFTNFITEVGGAYRPISHSLKEVWRIATPSNQNGMS